MRVRIGIQDKEEGFTLLEVMVAICLLSFGLLAMAAMQVAAIHGNSIANTVTGGTSFAMDRIELLASLPYDDSDLSLGDHGPRDLGGNYSVGWRVEDGDVINTKKIAVTVIRQDKGGVTRKTELIWIKPRL